jgi:hypothetical protein
MEKKEKNKSKNEFAYFIEDKSFGKLYVKKSANAWWMDRGKVERLITGCKMDCKPQECRLLAGISKDQLDYFEKMHLEFSSILEDMRKMPSIKARQTIIRSLENDPRVAMWYLERKEADEFKERKDIDLVERPILIVDDLFDFDKPAKEKESQAPQKNTENINEKNAVKNIKDLNNNLKREPHGKIIYEEDPNSCDEIEPAEGQDDTSWMNM